MENIKINSGIFKNKKHYFPVHICYNHTDAGRVVYFANYLRITEEARVALFTMLYTDSNYTMNENDKKGDFVVKSCSAEYFKSATLNDDIIVVSRFSEISKVYVILSQDIYKGDELLVSTSFKLVYVNLENIPYRPSRIPEFVLNAISKVAD